MKYTVAELIARLQQEPPTDVVRVFLAPDGAPTVDHIHVESTKDGLLLDGYLNKHHQLHVDRPAIPAGAAPFLSSESQETINAMATSGWVFSTWSVPLDEGHRGWVVKFRQTEGTAEGLDSSLDLNESVEAASQAALTVAMLEEATDMPADA